MEHYKKRHLRRLTAVAAASILAVASPVTAFGAKNTPNDNIPEVPEAPAPDYNRDLTPEFAYTEDKWASLRDNVMEYGELADLIHEYNPTVRSNRSTYNDQKNQDLTDINDQLMSDAMDLWDDAGATETDSYAGRMAAAQLDFAGNSLAKTADSNYKDAQMYKIQYDQTEANLVYQAQQLMVTYEQSAYTMGNLKASRDLAQASYEASLAQQAVGMSTQAEALSALKSVQDADAGILSAQKSTDNVHRSLCLMLGWSADAQPEIRSIPEFDYGRIASMNVQSDKEQALANNYDIKYYEKMLENVQTSDLKASAQANIDDAKNKVENSISTQYNAVLDAKDALDTANLQLQLETVNLNKVTARAATGNAGKIELLQQQTAYILAQNDAATAGLQLQLAMEKYDWIKKGLTFQS